MRHSSSRLALVVALSGVYMTVSIGDAHAQSAPLPTGGAVTRGSAAILRLGTDMTVFQLSRNAIIGWNGFSVGSGYRMHFENGSGATLNRVTGGLPSSIDGRLTATGSVYLINPAGVAVGSNGMVRTGGSFVASTQDIDDTNFLKGGDLTLKGSSRATVVNRGTIVSDHGDVVLTARKVVNEGSIDAPKGSVGLLAGYEVLLSDMSTADGKFQVKVGGADTEVVNKGTIRAAEAELRANGGRVEALAGNTKAIVKATGVKQSGGRIFLTAGDGGSVQVSQRLVARRAATEAKRRQVAALPDYGPMPRNRPDYTGGEVTISGGTIVLRGAVIDASGSTGGGQVLIGGGPQGSGDTSHAQAVSIDAASVIDASATRQGDGGSIVVWSDGATSVAATLTARGAGTGSGGAIETSGNAIDFTGVSVDASAPGGTAGQWLIGTGGLTVDAASAATIAGSLGGDTNVTLKTSATAANGDITIASALGWSSGAALTLDAYHSIAIAAPVTIGGAGKLNLLSNQGGTGGTITYAGGVTFTGGAGSGAGLTVNGNAYTLLYSMADVQAINASDAALRGNYALATSLDATGLAGWIPIGTDGQGNILNPDRFNHNGFTGQFTGLGHTISNLTVGVGNTGYAGLFGYATNATISDIGLIGGSVSGNYNLGGLIGRLGFGTISHAYATGAVNGGNGVGGLVGVLEGSTISQSYATGNVSGNDDVGGLVGFAMGYYYPRPIGLISQSYATGTVHGNYYVGGLVGDQSGTISQSYATGAVSGINSVGGLAGWQSGGPITQSYATGAISGGSYVGGLVGLMTADLVTINQSYATGAVSGDSYVGGLVGSYVGTSHPQLLLISQSYATGSVSGNNYVGGLVGSSYLASPYPPTLLLITQSYATGAVSGSSDVGGLIGYQAGGTISSSYFDSFSTGQANGVGSGSQAGVMAVTSDPSQSAAENYAFTQSAYSGFDWTIWSPPEAGAVNYYPRLLTVPGADTVGQ
ncbi:GLUG motif-containing protein [Rhizobium sp. WW_1]|uniref:two-partner secretion domain-containing protein n=1 Tax=Rhizobium sp. WW_1 TaxID=1907375 RepID=UPI000FF778B4|nr:GLUG motif-containing protein [Rhizobium sp. WW_1]RKD56230.1 filamentous hemagglutinin family protein [Rhizobium sp. WW_1]